MPIPGPHEKCPHCGRYRNRASVVNAVVFHQNRILLIKRNIEPEKGLWALPGGYMDWDETGEQAVLRELKEEAGIEAASPTFIGVYDHPSRSPVQNVSLTYTLTPQNIDPHPGDDADEAKWFDLDKLPHPLAFDHAQIIRDALQ